ncbi:MAG: PLP-dependent cysteine synthase family protein [Patescibacteria group bacterium]
MNITNTIGNTPLIKVDNILAKLETTNPTGSIKDRMVQHLVEVAEKKGELKKGSRIVEVTSGNTGISLAMFSALKGYRFTAVMPESMSVERRKMIEKFGAKIILTPSSEDMEGAVRKYQEIIGKEKNLWLPNQFSNTENIRAHQNGLGKEILKETNGEIDVFVAGVGTGGTLIGAARALKAVNHKIKIVAVEPEESAVLSGEKPYLHEIQGIGEGFIPEILKDNLYMIDDIIKIKSKDALKATEHLARNYGILAGISSGANFLAAKLLREKNEKVITVFADRGERYLDKIAH